MTTHPNRETWLEALANIVAPEFAAIGHPIPPFRVAIGFPSTGKNGKAAAEVWDGRASADGKFSILIRPDEDDPVEVGNSLIHELAHAAAGLAAGHTGPFAKICLHFGLLRPMTTTPSGPEWHRRMGEYLQQLGPLPHAKLTWNRPAPAATNEEGEGEDSGPTSSAPPKQGTRLLKCACPECGYTVRIARKWLVETGAPLCPRHGATVPVAA